MSRLGCTLGARPETFAGLSGMGDLIVTCASGLSRNRSVGERIGKGESIDCIMNSMEQVAEGVDNAASALALARSVNIEVPITEQVCSILFEGKNPQDAVESLLARELRKE
jgi:glycerol-3-phosphate dehydrogenase (NAD(P)+)